MVKSEKLVRPEIYNPGELKEICRLYKKHSPYFCVFTVDSINENNETHFIMCAYVKKNNDKIAHSHILVKGDLKTWISGIQNIEKYNTPVWVVEYNTKEKLEKFLKLP